MATTRTGNFPIGFRNNLRHWTDGVMGAARFAVEHGFEVIDIDAQDPQQIREILGTGVRVGSVDLKQPWTDLMSPDAARRSGAAETNAAYIREAAALGVQNFFTVMLPEQMDAPRPKNLERAVDGYGRLCAAIADIDVRLVLEGWPGPEPHQPALACTPESCRAVFEAIPSPALGLNYDPSHLMRMGIDPLRFLDEFGSRVYHAHAKDTEILEQGLYECGNSQPPTLRELTGYGAAHWRYCIPGHGQVPWIPILRRLVDLNYQGALSIELEDDNFTGTPERSEHGLIAARDFLSHA
jgi:sugar phosphate isomerase/epimerase